MSANRGEAARTGLAETFWRAGPPSAERTPQAVVQHALMSITAFEEGAVSDPRSGKPMSLMELLTDLGIEENLVYASPELARGEVFDERSLVFTIGVLIFERLTDRHPFGSADNPERIARIRRCEMGSGVNFFPSVPKELRTILMRCMGPFPEERYPDLQHLKQDLARFVGQPHLAAARPRRPGAGARVSPKFFEAPTVVRPVAEAPAPTSPAETGPAPALVQPSTRPPTGPLLDAPLPRPPAGSALGEPAPHRLAARLLGSSVAEVSPKAGSPAAAPRHDAPPPPPLSEGGLLEEVPQPAGADEVPPPPPVLAGLAAPAPSRMGRWAPVVYGLAGAGVASLVFLLISFGRGGNRLASNRPAIAAAGGTAARSSAAGRAVAPDPAGASSASATGPAAAESTATPPPARLAAPRSEPVPGPRAAQPVQARASKPTARPAARPEDDDDGDDGLEPRPPPRPRAAPARAGSVSESEALEKARVRLDPSLDDQPAEVRAGVMVAATIRSCGVGAGGAKSYRVAAIVQPDGKVVRTLANTKQGLSERQVACIRRVVAPLKLVMGWSEQGYIEWSVRIFPERVEATVAGPPELRARLLRR